MPRAPNLAGSVATLLDCVGGTLLRAASAQLGTQSSHLGRGHKRPSQRKRDANFKLRHYPIAGINSPRSTGDLSYETQRNGSATPICRSVARSKARNDRARSQLARALSKSRYLA